MIAHLILGGSVYAQDMDSVDADVEESVLDSDATSLQAKMLKERQKRLIQENAKSQKEAEALKQKASIKQKEAAQRLKITSIEVEKLAQEQQRLNGEIKAAEVKIAKSELIMKNAEAKLNRAKADVEAGTKLKEDRLRKVKLVQDSIAKIRVEQSQTQSQISQTKSEFDKLKVQMAQNEQRLQKAKAEALLKRSQLQEKWAKLKSEKAKSSRKLNVMEAEIGKIKTDINSLEDLIKTAQASKQSSEYKLQESGEELRKLRLRSKLQQGELQDKQSFLKSERFDKSFSRSDEASEVLARMAKAQKHQLNLSRAPTASTNPVRVELIPTRVAHAGSSSAGEVATSGERAPDSTAMRLTQDCEVFDRPSVNSKVLGKKRAGSTIVPEFSDSNWIAVKISKRRMYVSQACF